MTEREAIKLSLVAFEEINKLSVGENAICLPAEIDTAMDACRKVLAQPEQEPVAWINWCAATGKRSVSFECESELASQPLYAGITQNTQDHYSKFHSWFDSELHRKKYTQDHPAYLAAQEAWNAANDAAQHRINRLNAEIEAWKVRFKIAEDALVKLNGPEQPEPVIDKSAAVRIATSLGWEPKRKPLTDEEIQKCYETTGHCQTLRPQDRFAVFALARAIEAAHGIKE